MDVRQSLISFRNLISPFNKTASKFCVEYDSYINFRVQEALGVIKNIARLNKKRYTTACQHTMIVP